MTKEHEAILRNLECWAMASEAAASVSLSHEAGCDCVACRAAAGDEEAKARVLEVVRGRL